MMPPRKMPAFTKPSAKTVDAFARGVADDPCQLNAWLLRGRAYVVALPAKKKKIKR